VIAAMLTALASSARAETPKQQAKTLVGQANAAYKADQFDVALVDYTQAYELFPVPALLFNIGQCHRQLHHYALAAEAYEGFLARATPSADDRAMVQDLLDQVKRAESDERARQAAARRTATLAAVHAEPPRAVVQRADAPAPVSKESHPLYTRWWFWTAVGGAVAVAAGGAYFATHDSASVPNGSIGRLDNR
jgi:hypothetical protein